MGLFGGFKAKFTRNSTAKVKPQDVVCLKYHIHSEFDQQEVALPIQNNPNIKKNEVVRSRSKAKSRKELAKSAIFQENDTDYSYLSTPKTPQKSLSLTNLNGEVSKLIQRSDSRHREPSDSFTVSTTFEMPANANSVAVSDTKFGKSVEKQNGVVTEKIAIVTNNHLLSTGRNSKTEKHEQSILKSFSTHTDDSHQSTDDDKSDTYLYLSRSSSKTKQPIVNGAVINGNSPRHVENEQSTLIFMTQASTDSDKTIQNGGDNFDVNFAQTLQSFSTSRMQENFDNSSEDDLDGNFKINFVQRSATPDEEYKVNVVQHDYNRSYSFSEDERSYQEEEPPTFSRMGYSTQAASIFFGEDVEPEITRPRRIVLTEDDDDRRSSGADC